jgi:hypothetical protein
MVGDAVTVIFVLTVGILVPAGCVNEALTGDLAFAVGEGETCALYGLDCWRRRHRAASDRGLANWSC